MITRMWRGWTTPANAGAYEQFLLRELFPSLRAIPGFRGAEVLHRVDGDEVAFVTLTRFESLESVSVFAGDPVTRPVIEPRAAELLCRYDEHATHFETSVFS